MTDDELIEAVAKVMAENNVKERQDWSKLTKEQKGWWLSDAKYAIAVARPIIEAQERERWVKAMDSVLTKEQSYLFREICAAALKETGDD